MDGILTRTLAWVPGAAGLVLCWAAIHEALYGHRHGWAGPSGVMTVGFAAGAVVAFSVMLVAKALADHAQYGPHLSEEETTARYHALLARR